MLHRYSAGGDWHGRKDLDARLQRRRSEGDPESKPKLDLDATAAFARTLFPGEKLEALDDASLSFTCPEENELIAGLFPGVCILAAEEFGIDYPSKLPARFLEPARHRNLYLHAMHSVVDWFAYGIWNEGKLRRSLSLSPDSGLLEDIGVKLPFEEPYWAGVHPAMGPEEADECSYPFTFHPLELGEAALLDLFGYQLEGPLDRSQLDPEDVPLMRFKRSQSS